MRITIKPPSPAPSPPLRPGALLTVRVEASDPAPLLAGPVVVSYEGRYVDTPAPAFLFPASGPAELMTATAAHSNFRLPVAALRRPYVDVPLHEGDVVTATLHSDTKTYSASFRASGNDPVELTLAEGGAAPPGPPPPPPPTPQPAEGLTITPVPAAQLPPPLEQGDVVRLDTAPGADHLVVLVPAP